MHLLQDIRSFRGRSERIPCLGIGNPFKLGWIIRRCARTVELGLGQTDNRIITFSERERGTGQVRIEEECVRDVSSI